MEVCVPRFLPALPCRMLPKPTPSLLRSKALLTPKKTPAQLRRSESIHPPVRLPKARTSEETSTSITGQLEEASEKAVPADKAQIEKVSDEDTASQEASSNGDYASITMGESPLDAQKLAIEFLDGLKMKLGSEDTFSILVYGISAVVFLWVSSAIVGAVDSIPLFPKLLEVVGLGFTIWFSYRYLIFKKNRDELAAKIEELKQQIIGPSDE